VNGLLAEQGNGLLADMRNALLQQSRAQMQHTPQAPSPMNPLDTIALSTMAIPGVGDVAGLAADARRFMFEPESRTMGNYALSSLGLLPFVPNMTSIKSVSKLPEVNVDKFHINSAYGQNDYISVAKNKDGDVVGELSFSEYGGKPHINMIEVKPKYRRKGVGAELIRSLTKQKNQYDPSWQYKDIQWGMATEDGMWLKKKLDKEFLGHPLRNLERKILEIQKASK